jgi:hypothetical protein
MNLGQWFSILARQERIVREAALTVPPPMEPEPAPVRSFRATRKPDLVLEVMRAHGPKWMRAGEIAKCAAGIEGISAPSMGYLLGALLASSRIERRGVSHKYEYRVRITP